MMVSGAPAELRGRLPDPALVVLIGPAAAGKSTLAGAWPVSQVLSLDEYRTRVCDDPTNPDPTVTADAITLLHRTLSARMHRRLTTVVDAPNVEEHARRPLLRLAALNRVPAVAVVVATPLETCLARNAGRPKAAKPGCWGPRLPEAVIRSQHTKLIAAIAHLADEDFAGVHLLTLNEPAAIAG